MSNNLVQFLNQYNYEYVVKETGDIIEFSPITTGQIKSLLTYEGSDDIGSMERMLDDLITGCVTTDGFDINKLTIQDRFDLLIEIRKRTKGNLYSFVIRCPDCGVDTINAVDLDKLNIDLFPENLNSVIKLSENLSVEMDFIRRGSQKGAYDESDKQKGVSDRQKMVNITVSIYARCMKRFITPAGDVEDTPLKDKIELVEALDSETYNKISDWFVDNNYGTEFKYDVRCTECEFVEKKDIPISDFFA